MMSSKGFRIALLGVVASLVFVAAPRDALTQPARGAKAKPKPVTQADIERLEKKIGDQQRVLEKLVRLQQQYLQSMIALMPNADGVVTPLPETDVVAKVDPKTDPKPPEPKITPKVDPKAAKTDPKAVAKTDPKVDPKVEPKKPTKGGVGTVVGKVKGGGGDVFVYVEDVMASAGGSAAMKQEGKQFVPRVLAVQKGTRVEFPNRDAVFHNVFSVTPENSFDLGSYRQGESKSVTMTKPGVVSVYCNMHPQMVGYILVVPSSLYVRTGQDGFYRLPNVPAGKHRLVAWSPNAKPVVSEVEVADDEVVTVELEVKKGRSLPHTNKDGMPYGSYKD